MMLNTFEQAIQGSLVCRSRHEAAAVVIHESTELKITKHIKFMRQDDVAIVIASSYTPFDSNYISYRTLYVITCHGIGWVRSEYLKTL